MITVHHLSRSRSLRILWLLEELEVPYEVIRYERDAKTSLAPPELLEVHPLGKSPVVDIDGLVVAESGAIVEVLCARFGPQLVPAPDSEAYVRHLELMHFAEGSAMIPILLNLYIGRLGDAGAPLHPRINEQIDSHFAFMNNALRPSGHFVLDDISAVDIMLSFPAVVGMRLGRLEKYPELAGFAEAIHERPAFKRAFAKGGGD